MEIKVGDTVRFLDRLGLHTAEPQFYPEKGTTGAVEKYMHDDVVLEPRHVCFIKWRTGSTSENDKWWAFKSDLELISEVKSRNGLA